MCLIGGKKDAQHENQSDGHHEFSVVLSFYKVICWVLLDGETNHKNIATQNQMKEGKVAVGVESVGVSGKEEDACCRVIFSQHQSDVEPRLPAANGRNSYLVWK